MVFRQSAQKENNHYFEYRFHYIIREPVADSGMRKTLRFRYAWRRVQKHGNSLCLTEIKGFFRPDWNIIVYIHHLYMDHNKSFSRPKILHNHCFQFLPGITVVPKEIEDNGYAEFWGLRKVHYCIIVNVKMVNCHFFLFFLFVNLVIHINKFKETSICNQMATREINEYFHALFKCPNSEGSGND